MVNTLFWLVFFGLSSSQAASPAPPPSFTVGSATAAAGQKAAGYLDVPAGTDPATRIPVLVVRGAKPGPVLALVAGLHGTEYASILALYEVVERLDAQSVSGTVIVLPLVNTASFEQIVPHVNPVDRKSMNRFYPGKVDGTQTERASWIITHEVVDRCDALIDLHGGDLDESLRPFSYWFRSGDPKIDAASKEMLLAFGLDHIVIFDDFPKDPRESRYLDSTALIRGKPAIAVEAGYAGTTEPEDIDLLARGCISVMRHFGMLAGSPTPIEHPVWIEKLIPIESDQTGIFHPLVRRGTYVEAGMTIGSVTDYLGNPVSDVRAPAAGVILYIRAVPSLKKGDTLADLGVVARKGP
jgi:predicted deacylase